MHLKTNLIPEISDEDLEEMLETLRPIYPVVKNQYDCQRCKPDQTFFLIDLAGVDRRNHAYTWGPALDEQRGPVGIAWANGDMCRVPTFHTAACSVFFKPSLAEVYAAVRRAVPDWREARFLWLDQIYGDWRDCWGSYHMARAMLFSTEFPIGGGRALEQVIPHPALGKASDPRREPEEARKGIVEA